MPIKPHASIVRMAAILVAASALCGCSTALETTLIAPDRPMPAAEAQPLVASPARPLPGSVQAYGAPDLQSDGYPVANRPAQPLSTLKTPEEQAQAERRLREAAASANAAAAGAQPRPIDGQLQALGRTHASDAVKAIEAETAPAATTAPCLRGQTGCASTQ